MSTNLGNGPNNEPTGDGGAATPVSGNTGPIEGINTELQPEGAASGDQVTVMTKDEAIKMAWGNLRTIGQIASTMEGVLMAEFPELFREPEPKLPPGAVATGVVRPSHKE